jgi:hypothetical protein
MEAWLVTYGPGEVYWQRFGHNAIWIRDQGLGLNHVFNFGYFDFEQDAFYRRFLQGRLLYFAIAQEAEREFSQYINEQRSIRAQRLNLTGEQALRLADYLLAEVQPEKREYLYDYYTHNCSTRIRDALDQALDGVLADEFGALAADQTWRDHTRRLTAKSDWLYMSLEASLGAPVDQPITRWDEFFIPAELAAGVADVKVRGEQGLQSLVLEDVMLFESPLPVPPAEPERRWPRYLLAGTLLLLAAWFASRRNAALSPLRLTRTWLVIAGLGGFVLVYLWFFTDHLVARPNVNLLLLNPLWWILGWWKPQRVGGIILLLVSVLALIMPLVPPHQYNLDLLAACLPLNIAAGLVLLNPGGGAFRRQSRSAGLPGVPASGDR